MLICILTYFINKSVGLKVSSHDSVFAMLCFKIKANISRFNVWHTIICMSWVFLSMLMSIIDVYLKKVTSFVFGQFFWAFAPQLKASTNNITWWKTQSQIQYGKGDLGTETSRPGECNLSLPVNEPVKAAVWAQIYPGPSWTKRVSIINLCINLKLTYCNHPHFHGNDLTGYLRRTPVRTSRLAYKYMSSLQHSILKMQARTGRKVDLCEKSPILNPCATSAPWTAPRATLHIVSVLIFQSHGQYHRF